MFNSAPWVPPDISEDSAYAGKTYTVVLYHIPPFVEISDWAATINNTDPGNIKGTRTMAGGEITGLTIDVLAALETNMKINLQFVYPCKTSDFAGGACKMPTRVEALDMVKMGTSAAARRASVYIGGDRFCTNLMCFAAGAVKIDASTMQVSSLRSLLLLSVAL